MIEQAHLLEAEQAQMSAVQRLGGFHCIYELLTLIHSRIMNARIIVIVHLRLDTCNYYNGELVIEDSSSRHA